jgi:hypothetical protein
MSIPSKPFQLDPYVGLGFGQSRFQVTQDSLLSNDGALDVATADAWTIPVLVGFDVPLLPWLRLGSRGNYAFWAFPSGHCLQIYQNVDCGRPRGVSAQWFLGLGAGMTGCPLSVVLGLRPARDRLPQIAGFARSGGDALRRLGRDGRSSLFHYE